ncbi:MAG TPA: sugar kinase [Galbitalea sp.]|jgi:2-dehydro-3-deoxygluconokinase
MKPVVTLGETMGLFRAASIGSLAHVSDFTLDIGGAESNVAIGLARLGTPSRWLGRVGNDSIGRRVLRELRAEGVDVVGVVDDGAPTGIMIKEQRTATATRVQYYRAGSAGSRLCVEDLARADIPNASLLHVTGITPALSNGAHEAVLAAVSMARDAQVPVSFDLNHRSALWTNHPAAIYSELASQADIVFAGDDEARILIPGAETPAELAAGIAALGPSQVLIKLGAEGCVAQIDGVAYTRDAVAVSVVDTVGAGDAFVAGYLAELLAGRSVEERLTTAVTVGAFACLASGDWEGFPTRDELGLLGRTDPVQR